ncbi:hypothetical protein [Niallia sp. Krafla_26]|uniref:hypothetical protein n=1 Tax=Niallia sp. Krafla_26 TaxID=3064703 RepID=UPI003D171529
MTKLSNSTLFIILVIVFAIAGGISLLIKAQITEMEQTSSNIEDAIEQQNYTYALQLLEENNLEKLQKYSDQDLEGLKEVYL